MRGIESATQRKEQASIARQLSASYIFFLEKEINLLGAVCEKGYIKRNKQLTINKGVIT